MRFTREKKKRYIYIERERKPRKTRMYPRRSNESRVSREMGMFDTSEQQSAQMCAEGRSDLHDSPIM